MRSDRRRYLAIHVDVDSATGLLRQATVHELFKLPLHTLLHFRDDLLFNMQRVLDRQQVLMEILDTRNYMQQIHLAVEGLGQGLCHGAGASRVLWKIGWDQYSLQLCHLTSFV